MSKYRKKFSVCFRVDNWILVYCTNTSPANMGLPRNWIIFAIIFLWINAGKCLSLEFTIQIAWNWAERATETNANTIHMNMNMSIRIERSICRIVCGVVKMNIIIFQIASFLRSFDEEKWRRGRKKPTLVNKRRNWERTRFQIDQRNKKWFCVGYHLISSFFTLPPIHTESEWVSEWVSQPIQTGRMLWQS